MICQCKWTNKKDGDFFPTVKKLAETIATEQVTGCPPQACNHWGLIFETLSLKMWDFNFWCKKFCGQKWSPLLHFHTEEFTLTESDLYAIEYLCKIGRMENGKVMKKIIIGHPCPSCYKWSICFLCAWKEVYFKINKNYILSLVRKGGFRSLSATYRYVSSQII